MLPKIHVITSVLAVIIASFFFSLSLEKFLLWSFAAFFVTLFLDVDHIFYPLLRKEKKHLFLKALKNPFVVLQDTKSFRDEIRFSGLGYIRIASHLLFSAAIIAFSFLFLPNIVIPIVISLLIHLLIDTIDTFRDPLKL